MNKTAVADASAATNEGPETSGASLLAQVTSTPS